MTAGVYSMVFKVSALREEIGDPLDMYSVNCDRTCCFDQAKTTWQLGGGGTDVKQEGTDHRQ